MKYKFTVVIVKDENWYVSKCVENNIASQGKTIDESIQNLKEAVALYYEEETPAISEQTYVTTMELVI